ncbi:MAG: substrate-binding domain-containing protein [Roseburia intestinalis]
MWISRQIWWTGRIYLQHDLAEKTIFRYFFQSRTGGGRFRSYWTRLYYVGAQAFESGIMQGELAAEAFLTDQSLDKNGDGIFQYVVLEGEAGHQDAIVRTEYSVSTMIDSGVEVEKLGYAIANWNRAQAQTKMAQLMSQFGDSIELVIANNDDMALGAMMRSKRPILQRMNGRRSLESMGLM